MESLDLDGVLGQPCGAMGVEVMNTTTEHERVRNGCHFKVQFRNRMVIEYSKATLMYANLYRDKHLDRR